MTYCSARHSLNGNVHLQCLAGIHFNLLAESGTLFEQNYVLTAYIASEKRTRDGPGQSSPPRHGQDVQADDVEGEASREPAC